MRAVQFDEFGNPEVLRVVEAGTPEPGPGQVTVDAAYAGGAEPWHVGQPEFYAQGRSVAGFSILALAQSAPEALRSLAERAFRTVTEGTVNLPVTAEFALRDAAEAHRLMGGRTSTGKLLLRIAG